MKKHNAILIIVILAILTVLITTIYYSYWKVISVTRYDVKLSIGDRIGFDLGSQVISFGTMLPGSESPRTMEIANSLNIPIKVVIKHTGNTTKFVYPERNNFLVPPNSSEQLTFVARIPRNASYGNYTGTVIIRTLRV